jgi:DNA-binding winged helix-turn-helix (wHTH) protein
MATICQFGPFRLDPDAGILFRGAEPTMLGQRAIALLRVLLAQPGTPVSRDALIDAAWSGLAVEESNLTVQIAALRRILSAETGGEGWIETLPRRGYRYVGPAVVSGDRAAEAIPQTSPALALPDTPSIAVLPFANFGGDPEQAYFADGMVDDVITGLSRIKWGGEPVNRSCVHSRQRHLQLDRTGRTRNRLGRTGAAPEPLRSLGFCRFRLFRARAFCARSL